MTAQIISHTADEFNQAIRPVNTFRSLMKTRQRLGSAHAATVLLLPG